MKFEEVKKIAAWDVLVQLQKMTKENLQIIKKNTEVIELVLKGEIQVDSVGKVQATNNELMKKNSENLKLHNSLLSFLKMIQNSDEFPIINELDYTDEPAEVITENIKLGFDEYLQKTIDGLIVFDTKHPYFCSDDFREKLLNYYLKIEAYEKCSELSNSLCK